VRAKRPERNSGQVLFSPSQLTEEASKLMIRINRFIFVSTVLAIAELSMIAQQPAVVNSSNQSSNSGPRPQLQQHFPRYVIHRQDSLLIQFSLSPELNQTVTVQPDGYINLQSAGSLHVEGLTVPELAEAVKKAYAGILHDPIVNVDLEDFQKPLFTVTGQVSKPGQYELRSNISVAEAIAVAGGLQPTAKTQIFLFHRTPDGSMFQVQKFDLKAVLNGKNLEEDATVRPGDMIVIPEKFIANFKKYVPYSFNAGTFISPTQF
jgi:polysaccharide export outer membrane protein